MSARRQARGRTEPNADARIPADLAAGPRIDLWADPDAANPHFTARSNWKDARLAWARANGLADDKGHLDYRHLPPELCDRAPYYRLDTRDR